MENCTQKAYTVETGKQNTKINKKVRRKINYKETLTDRQYQRKNGAAVRRHQETVVVVRLRGYDNWLSVQDPQETPTKNHTQCTSYAYFNNRLGSPSPTQPPPHASQPQSLLSQPVPTLSERVWEIEEKSPLKKWNLHTWNHLRKFCRQLEKKNGWKKETKERNQTLSAAVSKRNSFSRFASSPRSPSLRRLRANESEASSMRLTRFEERVIDRPLMCTAPGVRRFGLVLSEWVYRNSVLVSLTITVTFDFCSSWGLFVSRGNTYYLWLERGHCSWPARRLCNFGCLPSNFSHYYNFSHLFLQTGWPSVLFQ